MYDNSIKVRLADRAQKYKTVFDSPEGQMVLEDLKHFCRANESTFHENTRVGDMLNGRREVFLRIQDHLILTDEELHTSYS